MKQRTLFFRLGAIAILLAIAAVMMVIGRGHTVYFDNKKLEANGETYDTPYKVCVYVGDERVAKLERAFKKLHDLTEGVHTALLKNRVFESLNAVVEDADIDALDEEITRSESTKAKNEETAMPASHEDSLVKPLKVVAPSQSGTATAGK